MILIIYLLKLIVYFLLKIFLKRFLLFLSHYGKNNLAKCFEIKNDVATFIEGI